MTDAELEDAIEDIMHAEIYTDYGGGPIGYMAAAKKIMELIKKERPQ